MAILNELPSGRSLPLPARLVVGRATTAGLRLDDKRVSGEHATLRWTGKSWEIRDLGSRNGTFVAGKRLGSGDAATLAAGVTLSFGDDAPRYTVVDTSPPGPVARQLQSGAWAAGVDGLLALPSPDAPEAVIFEEAGAYVLEQAEERRSITDGDVIEVNGQSFAISLPEGLEGTATVAGVMALEAVHMAFGVSLDEEHVQITLTSRGNSVPLEPREHGYVLLTLARQRLEDAALPSSEQGWIDRDSLLKMLQLDPNGLNVAIYRARGQLAAAGVDDAAHIVEVRRGQRRIGITPERLAVGPL